MATVVLNSRECDENRLPAVCIHCGNPVAVWKRKTFWWFPPFTYFLVVLGLVPFLIAAKLLAWRKAVTIPLCAAHRERGLFVAAGVSFGVLLTVVGLGWAVAVAETNKRLHRDPMIVYALPVFLMLGGFAVSAVASFHKVGARKITDASIRLRGVHPAFVAALEQARVSDGRSLTDGRPPDRPDWMRTLPKYGESPGRL